jgi:uncharacterized membrane protein
MSDPERMVSGAGAAATAPDLFGRQDAPIFELQIWPHRSLTLRGFAVVLGIVTVGLAAPLAALSGTNAAWGLLPFVVAALLALYAALRRSFLDGRLIEELRLWPDLITVERREPRGRVLRWHANPFWVQVRLLDDARIEKYLTLRGNGREIELGAFLSPDERVTLYHAIRAALGELRTRRG